MDSERLGFWAKYSLQRRMNRRQVLQAGSLVGAGLLAATMGCDSGERAKESSTPKAGGGTAAPKLTSATLRAAIGSDVANMDPHSLAGGGGGNWPNTYVHFDGWVRIDRDTSEPVPELLESFELLDGGKKYRLKVRPGVKFHNGEPLTAEHVKFYLDRIVGRAAYNPKYQAATRSQFVENVGEVEIADPMTAIVHMDKLDAAFLYRLTTYVMPKNYTEQVGDNEVASKPVGAGAFRFVSRIPDSEIRSTRYDDFFRSVDAKEAPRVPMVKDLIQKVIPEDQARVSALLAGEVDIVHNVSSDLGKQLESQKGVKVIYLNYDQPMHIQMNNVLEKDPQTGQPNPWRDKRVRQAANYAIDLDTIIKTILTGREARSYGSPGRSIGFPKDIVQKTFKYDPQQAKQLLAEAGYPNGFNTTLQGPIGRWPNSRQVMEAVGGYLTKVGINTTISEQQYQVIIDKIKAKTAYPLTFWGEVAGPEPSRNFRYGYHSKGADTNSIPEPIVDQWIEEVEREFDPKKRADLIGKVITKFYEDAQWIFLYEPVTVVAMSDKWIWEPYEKIQDKLEYWNIRPAQM